MIENFSFDLRRAELSSLRSPNVQGETTNRHKHRVSLQGYESQGVQVKREGVFLPGILKHSQQDLSFSIDEISACTPSQHRPCLKVRFVEQTTLADQRRQEESDHFSNLAHVAKFDEMRNNVFCTTSPNHSLTTINDTSINPFDAELSEGES